MSSSTVSWHGPCCATADMMVRGPRPSSFTRAFGAVLLASFAGCGGGVDVPGTAATAAGGDFACVRTAENTVRCWGANARGQLGDGTTEPSVPGVAVTNLRDVVEIAAGAAHACARRRDRSVVCWGDNRRGEVGNGVGGSYLAPVPVLGLGEVVHIAATDGYSCAIRTDARLACWGRYPGEWLETPMTSNANPPAPLRGLARIVRVSLAPSHGCAIDDVGDAYCWGASYGCPGVQGEIDGAPRRVQFLSNVTQISVGDGGTCARRRDGTVQCFATRCYASPELQRWQLSLGFSVDNPVFQNAREVATGSSFACARLEDGTLSCLGLVSTEPLAARPIDGMIPLRLSATPVQGLRNVTEITSGRDQVCARTRDGYVHCW